MGSLTRSIRRSLRETKRNPVGIGSRPIEHLQFDNLYVYAIPIAARCDGRHAYL